jgi:hypothetical protein
VVVIRLAIAARGSTAMPGSPTGPAAVLLLGPLTTKVCLVLGEGKVNVKAIYPAHRAGGATFARRDRVSAR